eukprot:GEMP01073636.1.p1 GENE.GEMP01073636.1~~GEMP01073636.1.p1  ORF type:complete len:341 (+),score=65.76 GEMP01073636.1:49-1071(+)
MKPLLQHAWLKLWESADSPFRYSLDTFKERHIADDTDDDSICARHMIAKYSPGRASKRPLNFIVESLYSSRPPEAFDFTKVGPQEELFYVVRRTSTNENDGACGEELVVSEKATDSAARVLVNINPVEPYHFIMVPPTTGPQFLTLDGLAWGVAFMRECPEALLTFNSLGAGASVNHLHWQGFFPEESYPIFNCSKTVVAQNDKIECSRVDQWPVPVLSCRHLNSTADLASVVSDLFPLIHACQQRNIAHNVFLRRGNDDRHGVSLEMLVALRRVTNAQSVAVGAMQVASLEVLGYWIIPTKEDFARVTYASLLSNLAAAAVDNDTVRAVLSDTQLLPTL